MYDALVIAGGRLGPAEARHCGTDIKALVDVGGRTLLEAILQALGGVSAVGRIIVVAPQAARRFATDADEWIQEKSCGEENLTAALSAGRTERAVFCASDLPFVRSEHIEDLLTRVPCDALIAYPIVSRAAFNARYPGARSKFARLADGEWTGASVFLVAPELLLRRRVLLGKAFAARKSISALVPLLGARLIVRFLAQRATIDDIEARAGVLLGGKSTAVKGVDPALAMDCDGLAELQFCRRYAANIARKAAESRPYE